MKKLHLTLLVIVLVLLNKSTLIGQCSDMITPVYINGSRADNPNESAVVSFDYNFRGTGNSNNFTAIATVGQVGAVWGTAYNQNNDKIYVSAVVKRHCDLSPDGAGAIYEIDNGSVSLWLDIDNLSGVNMPADPGAASRGLAGKASPNHDIWAYAKVGKEGIGAIEFSEDFSKLYVMDLSDRKVLIINYATKSLLGSVSVPSPLRGWGIACHDGNVYVGAVDPDEGGTGASNATQHIMKFNNTNNPTALVDAYTFSNDYATKVWSDDWHVANPGSNSWNYPQAIISSIKFDSDGNMAIGIMDRFGHQSGESNYPPDTADSTLLGGLLTGRIWYAPSTGSGQWGTINHDFYQINNMDGQDHFFSGGMALSSCTNTEYLTANIVDPFRFGSSGPIWVKTSNGQRQGSNYNADCANEVYYSSPGSGYFSKAGGLGDLEYLGSETNTRRWQDK